jgi:hypothetical protein
MTWTGFEPELTASERPQTYGLNRVATRAGIWNNHTTEITGLGVRTNEQGDFCVQRVVRIP